jgi:ABC-type lipoprotein release transport system permease subunit
LCFNATVSGFGANRHYELKISISAKVQSWEQINTSRLDVFQVKAMRHYVISAIVPIVAGLGIENNLSTMISQQIFQEI